MREKSELPVVVIGAGPVGLAAAAHLLEQGLQPLIFESGPSAGAAVSEWGHIRLFSPWRYNIDAAARRLLEPTGWKEPRPTALPYGRELVERYLEPLAAVPAISTALRTGSRVVAVSREGMDKSHSKDRDLRPFLVRVESEDGSITDHLARAVLDASGTWHQPAPLGQAGLPAPGEAEARGILDPQHLAESMNTGTSTLPSIAHSVPAITGPLPDVTGRDRERFAGKHVLVVGSGHSAANTLLALTEVQRGDPDTRISWAVRGASVQRLYGGGPLDQLPARGMLGARLRRMVDDGRIDLTTSFTITGFAPAARASAPDTSTGLTVQGRTPDGPREMTVDVVVPTTGFRPDLGLLSELRLELDPAVEAPRELGPLIDPEFHSCGTVPAHGARALAHPEKDFYIVGMKSYGRAPTFLLATGYEQVRSVAAALAGDLAAAERVELDLPQTGVCSTSVPEQSEAVEAAAGAACCGTAGALGPEPVAVGFATGTEHGRSGDTP
ncbi:FAD-dependent oxidoreductase [Arthrobacter monumenti]